MFSLFNIAFYHFPFLIHKALFPGGVPTYWENRSRRLNKQRDAAFFRLITRGIILKSEQRTYTSRLLLEPRLGMQITRKSKRVERQVKKETKEGGGSCNPGGDGKYKQCIRIRREPQPKVSLLFENRSNQY